MKQIKAGRIAVSLMLVASYIQPANRVLSMQEFWESNPERPEVIEHKNKQKALVHKALAEIDEKQLLAQARAAKQAARPLEPIHKAAIDGDVGRVRALLNAGAAIDARAEGDMDKNTFYEVTPLHFAVFHGHLAVVKLLLGRGAGIDAQAFAIEEGSKPARAIRIGVLHIASHEPTPAMYKLLLEHKATVNQLSVGATTPLAFYIEDSQTRGKDYYKIVNLLLDYGADLNAHYRHPYDEGGQELMSFSTPFAQFMNMDRARRASRIQQPLAEVAATVERMLKMGANPNYWHWDEGYYVSPLQASRYLGPQVVETRLAQGANPNTRLSRRHHSLPLLSDAYLHGKLPVVKLLLKHGAQVDATDNFGKTIKDYAREKNDSEMIALLEQYEKKQAAPAPAKRRKRGREVVEEVKRRVRKRQAR